MDSRRCPEFVLLNACMSTAKRVLLGLVGLFVLEALTFYAYSLLWLAHGQPQNSGSASMTAWAWGCLVGMLLELIIVPVALYRWVRPTEQAA